MAIGSRDVDFIGVPERTLRKYPRPVHIGPRYRPNVDAVRVRVDESLRHPEWLKGMITDRRDRSTHAPVRHSPRPRLQHRAPRSIRHGWLTNESFGGPV